MSSDFYFKKWKKTLVDLKTLVDFDKDYQETKAHDKTECEAVHRLTRVLASYMAVYNDAMECLQQNLQVQKTRFMRNIIIAVVSRILELKHQINKLECSDIHFIGNGLFADHLTVDNAEIKEIPEKVKRPELVQTMIDDIMQSAKTKREALANPEPEEESIEIVYNWWDIDETTKAEEIEEQSKEDMSEEVRKRNEMIALIQAHEKSRQTIRTITQSKQKRELWEKELAGTAQPKAKYEIKERSSELIQKVIRAYFEIKRQKITQCKRDEICGFNYCLQPKRVNQDMLQQTLKNRLMLYDEYENEWEIKRKRFKEQYLEKKKDEISEDYRDQIRDWFLNWFQKIQFIHEIPKNGSVAIFNGEISEPEEWIEEYKELLEQRGANKNKSALERKFEQMEAKREQLRLKREEYITKREEADLLKKIMKNPTMHPGYNYPQSKKMNKLIEVMEEYNTIWANLDQLELLEVKEKFVHEIDVENSLMEVKFELLPTVDEQMKKELHKLKISLKEDYARNEMQMPEDIYKPRKREKKKKKEMDVLNQKLCGQLEELAVNGFIRDYTKIKIEDFIGDPNFAGSDLRCQLELALPLNAEIRALWWERCHEVIHGCHKILLIAPRGGGKTRLVHALACINDAVLFELDPIAVQGDFFSAAYLQQIVQTVGVCAKAVQPAVIHIKHVEKLFYLKVPPGEAEMCLDMIKNFFITKLFKRIKKTDNITIIGSCTDPWKAKSRLLLKRFPKVLLLPNTSYSLVAQMLKEWVVNHKVKPADLNVSSLAHMLQGYSFGYLKAALDSFMTADRIVRIAAYGLNPMDVYNYILEDQTGTKTEYDKYMKWYTEKTKPGRREHRHLEARREFQLALDKYAEKTKKKKKIALSNKSSISTLK